MKPIDNSISLAESVKLLEQLMLDSGQLIELSKIGTRFNIFDAVGMKRQEIKHSHFLGTLFDPHGGHSLGTVFFEAFFKSVLSGTDPEISDIGMLNFAIADFDDLMVFRERYDIDILIVSKANKFVFAIENKVDSKEHGEQLKKYNAKLTEHFPDYRYVKCYLTLDASEASDSSWIPASYAEVISAIDTAMHIRKDSLSAKQRILIEDYITLLKEELMSEEDEAIKELAQKIYLKHKEAIDLIVEHIPDEIAVRSEQIKDYFLTEYSALDFEFDSASKCFVRFAYKPWDQNEKLKTGTWGSCGRILMIEIQQVAQASHIVIHLAPSEDDEFRKTIYETTKAAGLTKGTLRSVHTPLLKQRLYTSRDLNNQENSSEDLFGMMKRNIDKFMQQDWQKAERTLREVMLP